MPGSSLQSFSSDPHPSFLHVNARDLIYRWFTLLWRSCGEERSVAVGSLCRVRKPERSLVWASLMAQWVQNPPAVKETREAQVRFLVLGRYPLQEAAQSSNLVKEARDALRTQGPHLSLGKEESVRTRASDRVLCLWSVCDSMNQGWSVPAECEFGMSSCTLQTISPRDLTERY